MALSCAVLPSAHDALIKRMESAHEEFDSGCRLLLLKLSLEKGDVALIDVRHLCIQAHEKKNAFEKCYFRSIYAESRVKEIMFPALSCDKRKRNDA